MVRADAGELLMNSRWEPILWMSHRDWYRVVDGKIVLTDMAPKSARDSFELWRSEGHNAQKPVFY